MNDNISLALQLAILAAQAAARYTQLVQDAKASGGEVTDEQLDAAGADYRAAHADLDKALGK